QDGARFAALAPHTARLGRPPGRRRAEAHAGSAPWRPAPFPPAAHRRAPRPRHPPHGAGCPLPAVRAVYRALAASSHSGFRILQFSAQDNHMHLIVEADDTPALRRGLRGLAIRAARAVNRALNRRGAVWQGRYHTRELSTPRAVRHALVYVLMNIRKHRGGELGLDPCSSAVFFDGWREPVGAASTPAPVARPRTWLATVGWRRYGLLGLDERP